MGLDNFYKGKKVLVTGHSGFKGSWLTSALLYLGADVCGISLEPNTNPNLFSILNLENKIDNHFVDIRDYEKLKDIFNTFKPEIVLHLAAQPLVIDSYKNPRYTYEVNVMGTVNVCECIKQCSSVKSFVNVTTDKVYENIEDPNHYYQENEKLNGYDPYSNSKSCSELVTSSYIKSFLDELNIPVSTCRAGNVIGGGDYSENRIIPDCVKAALNNKTIKIRNPESVRPYQHVLEADMFYLLLAKEQYSNHNIASNYNIGPNELDCVTTKELVDLFVNSWGNVSYELLNANGPHEANYLKLNTQKAKNTFNWNPRWDIITAINKVVEWNKSDNKEEITIKQIKDYLNE